ncbi:PAP2 superfamily protein [Actinocorallia herbida]|uniref:PAP2 superfamily protein n=1 Tax=Actinocorallia herbida TaxID=58109 RepID=A0A3N1CN45_9ACTN|nr:phosphatase PAP2 family protein [Actinocorallia herbida]ROO82741.1 PAP2 superfamily protein [Actinocorallia herbida]
MSIVVVGRKAGKVAVGCGLALCALYLLAVASPPGQLLEDAVLRVADNGHADPLAARLAERLLGLVSVWSVAAALAVVFETGRRRGGLPLAFAAVVVIAGPLLTVELLQSVLPRPLLLAHGIRREDQGFPSGHTAVGMAALCAVALVAPYRLRTPVLLAALPCALAGAATVAVGWHRPSDTLGSDLVVLCWTAVVLAFLAHRGALRQVVPQPDPRAPAPVDGRGERWTAGVLTALAWLLAGGVLAGGLIAAQALRSSPAPEETVLLPAFWAGQAAALLGSVGAVLGLLAMMRGLETVSPGGTRGPARIRRTGRVR